jgi:hypothetical protein
MSIFIESHGFFGKTEPVPVSGSVKIASDYTNKHASVSGLVSLGTTIAKDPQAFAKNNPNVISAFKDVAKDDALWKDYCKILSKNYIANCTALNLVGFRSKIRQI